MMRRFALLLLCTVALASCDKVSEPDQRPKVCDFTIGESSVTRSNATVAKFRKVLVEDYTGHRCPNCPRAAEAAEALLSTYDGSVVVIANHVSKTYAAPQNDSLYKEDFRNANSTDWDKQLAMSAVGLPKGGVNRVAPFAQNYSSWSGLVATALAKPQSAQMDVTTIFDPPTNKVFVKVKTTFLKSFSNAVNLVIVATQDSIFSDQEDNQPPPSAQVDPNDPIRRLNYRFDHIVIGALNSTQGDLMKNAPAANDTVTFQNCYTLDRCFFDKPDKPKVCINTRNINIVAFLYDVSTSEVVQVEKVKIR